MLRGKLLLPARATWLQLPHHQLHLMVDWLYERTLSFSIEDETAWLAALGNPAHPGWDSH